MAGKGTYRNPRRVEQVEAFVHGAAVKTDELQYELMKTFRKCLVFCKAVDKYSSEPSQTCETQVAENSDGVSVVAGN